MKKYIQPEIKYVMIDTDDVMENGLDIVSVNDEYNEEEQLVGKGMFQDEEMKIEHTSVWDK